MFVNKIFDEFCNAMKIVMLMIDNLLCRRSCVSFCTNDSLNIITNVINEIFTELFFQLEHHPAVFYLLVVDMF